MASTKHWTEETFIDNPLLFLPDLMGRWEKAKEEAENLIDIFYEYKVPDDGRVLDLACGIGRHSIALAKQGYRCVGVDISPNYIAKARELAAVEGVEDRCSFVACDMRRLKDSLGDTKFDATISMYTSLGYYDAETDTNVLGRVNEPSKKGILVVEMMNRGYAEKLTGRRYSTIGDLVKLEESFFNVDTSRLRAVWRMYRQRGQDLEYVGSIRFDNKLYTEQELIELAESAGWENNLVYGGLDRSGIREDSNKIVLVAW